MSVLGQSLTNCSACPMSGTCPEAEVDKQPLLDLTLSLDRARDPMP